MSAQTIAEAFAPCEARFKTEVMAQTWGHLAPNPRREYHGSILFAHGAYGDLVPLRADFDGMPDSPWFFQDMMDFIAGSKTEPGCIYEFDGTYTKRKNGTYHFKGRTVERMPPAMRFRVGGTR